MRQHFFYLVILFVATFSSCSSGEDDPQKLSPEVSEYLKMRFGNSQMKSLDAGGGNPAQASFSGMMKNLGIGSGRLGDGSVDEDSIIYVDPWIWTTCAEITKVENGDGSTTETYDYGDGCYDGYAEYQYLMKGKYAQTFKNNYLQNGSLYYDDYLYNVVYENFGGTYYGEYYDGGESSWNLDGFSNYSGSSTYNQEKQTFTGSYEYSSETSYEWDEYKYFYKSEGSSTYDNTKFISNGSYEYSSESQGQYYAVNILEPLVTDYSCYVYNQEVDMTNDMAYWFTTYISGIESIVFNENGISGAFTIDYGNGKCDNIVTITENGISVIVDLGNLYSGEI